MGLDANQITSNDIKQFLEGIDTDKNGSISFVEFETWFREAITVLEENKHVTKKKKQHKTTTLLDSYLKEKDPKKQILLLQSLFSKYDTNTDSKIDKNEFVLFLKDLFQQFDLGVPSDDHIVFFFDTIDTDKSNDISLNEIDSWLRGNMKTFQQK